MNNFYFTIISQKNTMVDSTLKCNKVGKDGELVYNKICANKSNPYSRRAQWESCTANSPKENVIKFMH